MITGFKLFVDQVLSFGGFRITEFPGKLYRELLTALGTLRFGSVLMIPALIDFAKERPGYLSVDDTSNPKYGLAKYARTLYNTKTRGYRQGYKVVMFLWVLPNGQKFPIGFALWYQGSGKLPAVALRGLSVLRNHF